MGGYIAFVVVVLPAAWVLRGLDRVAVKLR